MPWRFSSEGELHMKWLQKVPQWLGKVPEWVWTGIVIVIVVFLVMFFLLSIFGLVYYEYDQDTLTGQVVDMDDEGSTCEFEVIDAEGMHHEFTIEDTDCHPIYQDQELSFDRSYRQWWFIKWTHNSFADQVE
jgi:hypothetical protein